MQLNHHLTITFHGIFVVTYVSGADSCFTLADYHTARSRLN